MERLCVGSTVSVMELSAECCGDVRLRGPTLEILGRLTEKLKTFYDEE